MKAWIVLLVILIFLLAGCSIKDILFKEEIEPIVPEPKQGEGGGLNLSAKVLFIIAQNNFRDEELFKPKQILESAGCKCDIASITTDQSRGTLGTIVKPDLAVMEVNVSNYDLVVVVGGSGAPELAAHSEVIKLLQQANASNKKIGAICLGSMVLAKAGVLKGKKATVFKTPESIAALEQGGAILVDQNVVVETNLVTANGPDAATKFGNALVSLLRS